VSDRVRGSDVELTVDESATVTDVIERMISSAGLPRTTTAGTRLEYQLFSGEAALPPSQTVADLGLATTADLALVSPEAGAVWERVRSLSQEIRGEVVAGARGTIRTAEDEVRTSVDRVRGEIEHEVRGLLREATGGVEQEVTRRIRGAGKELRTWARRRIRRQVNEIAATGAVPAEVEALSLATGQLRRVAQSALVLPLAGAVTAAWWPQAAESWWPGTR